MSRRGGFRNSKVLIKKHIINFNVYRLLDFDFLLLRSYSKRSWYFEDGAAIQKNVENTVSAIE